MATPRIRIFSWYTCGLAILLLAGIIIYLQTNIVGKAIAAIPPPQARKTSIPSESRDPVPQKPRSLATDRMQELPDPVLSPLPPGSTESQDWIEKRIDQLDDLAWFDDSESLGKILTELRNPLPEIRAAALEATRDFGSRDAIPYLEAISSESKDPLEQKAMQDLIEFLNIPTLSEQSEMDAIE